MCPYCRAQDLRSVCSCTCLTCHPALLPLPRRGKVLWCRGPGRRGSRSCSGSGAGSPPPAYSDYCQSPPRSRPESVHDIRSCDYDGLSLLGSGSKNSLEGFHNHFITASHASSQYRLSPRYFISFQRFINDEENIHYSYLHVFRPEASSAVAAVTKPSSKDAAAVQREQAQAQRHSRHRKHRASL